MEKIAPIVFEEEIPGSNTTMFLIPTRFWKQLMVQKKSTGKRRVLFFRKRAPPNISELKY